MRMSVSTSRYFNVNPAENIPAPLENKSILTYTEKTLYIKKINLSKERAHIYVTMHASLCCFA